MVNQRCEHLVVDVTAKLMSDPKERVQAELDKHGMAGWELVAAVQPHPMSPLLLFFKRPV